MNPDGSVETGNQPPFVTQLPFPYQSLDPDGTILAVNESWLETLEYDRSEVVGAAFERFLAPQSTERFQSAFPQFKQAGTVDSIEFEMRTGTGERIVVSFSGRIQYDGTGEIVKTHCQFKDITDRVANEQQLLQYKQGIESSTNLIAAIDTDYSYLFANGSYKAFHGLAPETEIATRTVQDVIGRDEFDRVKGHVDRALQGESTEVSIERTDPDGTATVLNARYFPLRNAAGEIKGSVGVFKDITEQQDRLHTIQKLAEYRRVASVVNKNLFELTNVRDEFATLADTIGSSSLFECTFIYLFDRVGQDVVCSSNREVTAEEIDTFHTEEYIDTVSEQGTVQIADVTKPPYNQHPTGDVPSHKGIAIAIAHESTTCGILTVHLPPESDIDQEGVRLLENIADNIGLALRSQDLEHDRQIFREIIERIGDPIMLQNLDGDFQIINQAVAEYAGTDRADLMGHDEDVFMDAETATTIQDMKEKVIEQDQTVKYQVSPSLPDSSDKAFSTVRYPYTNKIGETVGSIAICRDITEVKRRERQLKIFERVLRHNLRNDMNAIMTQAELLLNDPDTEADTAAQKIVDVSESLIELTEKEREIVDVLRERQSPTRLEIRPVLQRIARQVRNEYPDPIVNLQCSTDAEIWAIPAIEKGLYELVENGVKHSDREPASVEISVAANTNTIEITIQDNGPGVPEMERRIVSEQKNISPLFHGSGLGIWLAKFAISQSEGSLTFDDASGDGSRIEITLPVFAQ